MFAPFDTLNQATCCVLPALTSRWVASAETVTLDADEVTFVERSTTVWPLGSPITTFQLPSDDEPVLVTETTTV